MFGDLKEKLANRKLSLGEADLASGLKEKLAGLDKKRIYTAVTALIIAGAAGYIMQRGANPSNQADPQLAAAEVAAPVVASLTPAPPRSDTAPMQAQAPASLASARLAGAEPPVAASPASAAVVGLPDPAPVLAQGPLADPLGSEPDPAVTRSASETALTFPEAAAAPAASEPPAEQAPQADLAVELAAVSDLGSVAPEPSVSAAEASAADVCTIHFGATPAPAALVALSLDAPCNSGEEVNFEHYGLRFSEQLGPEGKLDLLVPAMADNAIFVASFGNGARATAKTDVPDFADYDRVALVWKGATGLQLHALENGASYGEPGHVWADAPGVAAQATEGKGGFVSVLGSTAAGYAADVYTYPDRLMDTVAAPQVSIEAQVMENTCDSRIEGAFLHANAGRAPTLTDVTMAVPGCDAVGEYLVLSNLPQDLKIARN